MGGTHILSGRLSRLCVRGASWLVPLGVLLLVFAFNPRLYTGGGGDDWHYLEAARCAAANGVCLPDSHWAARFPLILPMGLALHWFGEGEATVALVPLCYAIAAVLLFAGLVRRRYGARIACVAGAVLALTPLLAFYTGQPMVDVPEFAWTLATFFAIERALAGRDRRWAVLAGVALALAVMTRTSSFTLLPILGLGWLRLDRARKALALPMAVAFALVLGGEALAYLRATGDPAYGWGLALHHTRFPTTELPPGLDPGRSPILNLELIRHWRRSMGIEVHWTIDPLLNLLADPFCGLTLCGALALGVVRARDWWRDRWLPMLALAAALHFVLLTYGLAVDPKPRMFLLEIATASLTIGVLTIRGWHAARLIVAALAALLVGRAILVAYDQPRMAEVRRVAARWIDAAGPDALAADEWTRRTITLVPTAHRLPLIEAALTRQRLVLGTAPCGGGRVLREALLDPAEGASLGWLRAHGILLRPHPPLRLCLIVPAGLVP